MILGHSLPYEKLATSALLNDAKVTKVGIAAYALVWRQRIMRVTRMD